jgi:hypothetical protein
MPFRATADREMAAAIELAKHTIRANGYRLSDFKRSQIVELARKIITACGQLAINP